MKNGIIATLIIVIFLSVSCSSNPDLLTTDQMVNYLKNQEGNKEVKSCVPIEFYGGCCCGNTQLDSYPKTEVEIANGYYFLTVVKKSDDTYQQTLYDRSISPNQIEIITMWE